MKTNDAIFWLRMSYWAGAVLDALAALSMLFPSLFAATNRLPNFQPGIEFNYAMGMGASLMLGWTALLVWADRKPLERKGVLLLTFAPVVLGLVANEIVAVRTGFLSISVTAPLLVVQALISTLFVYSYLNAGKLESTEMPAR